MLNHEAAETLAAPAEDAARVVTRRGQVTAQLFAFAAHANRQLAADLRDSPKVTLSAAVLAFGMLDPEIQVEYLSKARAEHLRFLNAE